MIELFSSLTYDFVESSWHVSAVVVKYYLLFTLVKLKLNDSLSQERLTDTLMEESPIVLFVIGFIGGLSLITGLEVTPRFVLLSEAVSLSYLGYLFWKF